MNRLDPVVPTTTYKLRACGQKFINGISSRYECVYSSILENVVSDKELTRIIDELNDVLMDNWPCNVCYVSGYALAPCTLGLSLLLPGHCASQAEVNGQKFLRNVSLTARFFDRNIVFKIVKSLCDSFVEIRFPSSLVPKRNFLSSVDLESGQSLAHVNVGGVISDPNNKEYPTEMSPLINSLSGGRRIKDN